MKVVGILIRIAAVLAAIELTMLAMTRTAIIVKVFAFIIYFLVYGSALLMVERKNRKNIR